MKLIDVQPRENFHLHLVYEDGVSGDVDLTSYAGKGVFESWLQPGVFEKVQLVDAGHPEWPGGIDLCPDGLYLKLTNKQPEEIFPALKRFQTHA